ncbi:MAG: methionyl-tRNA formyltransferase [bacterium]
MRIIFMGSAGFACPCLETLLKNTQDDVVAVVTQPDRPKGRNLELSPCPVKDHLGPRLIPVFSPEKVNSPESLARLLELKPDLIVVVAYGQLLKSALLKMAPLGVINVHGSLLPKYRGAAPIQWAVANGDQVSGVTTMYLNERMDAGDMILKRELPIAPSDTGGSYHDKLAGVGAEVLAETLDMIRGSRAPRVSQCEADATVAPKLKKLDGRIDWTLSASAIHNRIRGFNPWPGTFCVLPSDSGKQVKILTARVEPGHGAPGTVIALGDEGPLVQAGDGRAIRLLELQPEGRKPMTGAAFLRGHSVAVGAQVL